MTKVSEETTESEQVKKDKVCKWAPGELIKGYRSDGWMDRQDWRVGEEVKKHQRRK